MIRRERLTTLKWVLAKAWGRRKPGMRVCSLTACGVGGEQRLESFSTWDSYPRSAETLSFKHLKFPFDPFSEQELKGDSQDYTCAGDLYSDSGITDEMRSLRCLGSGQQFTGALAAKEDCQSFPDSDPRLEKEEQQREQRCVCTCSKRRPPESHCPPLGKPRATSVAKGSGGGARRHGLASQSQPHSGAEWQATHDGRRCLARQALKKKKKKNVE